MRLSSINAAPQRPLTVAFDLDNTIICMDASGIRLRRGMVDALKWTKDRGHIVWICSSAEPAWVRTALEAYPEVAQFMDRIITCVDIDTATCGTRQFKDVVKMGIDILFDDYRQYKEDARKIYGDAVADRYVILPKFDQGTDDDSWKHILTDAIMRAES